MKKLILLALLFFSLNIHSQVELKYLGTAGWEISDDNITVLIDPYISRVKLGSGPSVNKLDKRKTVLRSDFFVSDSILIDSLIDKVDFILVHHSHFDHYQMSLYRKKKLVLKL